MKSAKYIVIEGGDGSGKTTQVQKITDWLNQQGIAAVTVHEPGGNQMACEIGKLIKDASLKRLPMTDLLLFSAARVELWPIIKQHLSEGTWVISSRSYLSSLVYQGMACEIGEDKVLELSHLILPEEYFKPDLEIIITSDPKIAKNRRQNRNDESQSDHFESRDDSFLQKLAEGYQLVASECNLPTIDSNDKDAEQVFAEIKTLIKQTF